MLNTVRQQWIEEFDAYCDEPAFPSILTEKDNSNPRTDFSPGLSRLEYFTAKGMQALMQLSDNLTPDVHNEKALGQIAMGYAYATLQILFTRENGVIPKE